MKTITVRYFAMFREQAGIDEETLSLEAATAAECGEMAATDADSNAPAERAPTAETLARIETEVARASALDDRARQMAGSGDFPAAIRNQEAAVAHLTRALQLGGVFIPR